MDPQLVNYANLVNLSCKLFPLQNQPKRFKIEFSNTTSEILWLGWLLQDMGVSSYSITPIYCYNCVQYISHMMTSFISLLCLSPSSSSILQLQSIPSHDYLANMFTKSHPSNQFYDLVSQVSFQQFILSLKEIARAH